MSSASRKLLLGLPLLIIAHCSPASDVDGPDKDASLLPELYVPIDSYDFSNNPELLKKIVASPYQYFRFINKRSVNRPIRMPSHWPMCSAGRPMKSMSWRFCRNAAC